MSIGKLAVATLFVSALGVGSAMAQPANLQIVMGGEAYDGAPRFEVTFDGEKVGEGTVESAIDTASMGRFADATVKSAYLQTFDFEIPEGVFHPGGEVRIKLVNEAYGGPGSNRDRNLYLHSLTLNGAEIAAAEMTTVAAEGLVPSAMLGEYLVLFDHTTEGVAQAPGRGWAPPDTDVAAIDPAPEAETAAVEETVAPNTKPVADLEVAEPAAEPIPPAPEAVEIAAAVPSAPPAAPLPVETIVAPRPVTNPPLARIEPEIDEAPASVPEPPEGVTLVTGSVPAPAAELAEEPCSLDNLYNVVGFNENSNDLTPRIQERLDQIIADIGSNECEVQVMGYSSTQGDFATNALFAVERAQNVLRYLRQNGLRFAEATAAGAGETEQFGPRFSDNRRVVITVTP